MYFIPKFIRNFITKQIPVLTGRWKLESCNIKVNRKIDLANEDHCGPCGQNLVKQPIQNNNKFIQ